LLVMLERINLALAAAGLRRPKRTLADAGYCSTSNIDAAGESGHDLLVATGRLKHSEQVRDAARGRIPNSATSRERMARRLRTKAGRADYARRKVIIEPVFGQMKVKQNAGQLRLRGLAGAQGEFILHAICHNLRKLANATHPACRLLNPHRQPKSPRTVLEGFTIAHLPPRSRPPTAPLAKTPSHDIIARALKPDQTDSDPRS